MKELLIKQKGIYLLLILLIIGGLLSNFGDHKKKTAFNEIMNKNKTAIFSDEKAVEFAIQAILNSKVTTLPKECLSILNIEKVDNIITFDVRELHGGVCAGDTNTSPLITIAQVNVKTREVGVQMN